MAVETSRDRLARYARGESGWLGLRTAGIAVAPDGGLRLESVPGPGSDWGPPIAPLGGAPGGVVTLPDGSGFVCDPGTGRVLRVTACAPAAAADGLAPLRPDDEQLCPGLFRSPRGICLGPRGRLYVADTDAVLVIEPRTGAVTGRWALTEPWSVHAAGESVYVLDRGGPAGTGRVSRFDADGGADAGFTPTGLTDPVRVDVTPDGGVVVLDRIADHDSLVRLDVTGATVSRWRPTRRGATAQVTDVVRCHGMAISAGRVHVIDAAQGDLVVATMQGDPLGVVQLQPDAADVLAAGDALFTMSVGGGRWQRHEPLAATVGSGVFVTGPVQTATETGRRELRARVRRGAGQHVRFWTAVVPPEVEPGPETLPTDQTAPPGWVAWQQVPVDVDAALLSLPSGPHVWIGGELASDGTASPQVDQVAVAGAVGWIDDLPEIYRKDPGAADFLDRLLRLLASLRSESQTARRELVAAFDAWTALDVPAGALEQLAAWVLADLDERWDEQARRASVANAHETHAVRGTPAGLAAALTDRFGVQPVILHPAQSAATWILPAQDADAGAAGCDTCHGAGGGLGFTTGLAASAPAGAVVDASAPVDQSRLTGGERQGEALFTDLAHRFVVRMPLAAVAGRGGEAAVRDVIDAQQPAHTTYTLCLFEPQARVGIQSQVGVDLIVGAPSSLRLDTQSPSSGALLAGVTPRIGAERAR